MASIRARTRIDPAMAPMMMLVLMMPVRKTKRQAVFTAAINKPAHTYGTVHAIEKTLKKRANSKGPAEPTGDS